MAEMQMPGWGGREMTPVRWIGGGHGGRNCPVSGKFWHDYFVVMDKSGCVNDDGSGAMNSSTIFPRVVLCDVYGTLLNVQPPPEDSETRWQALAAKIISGPEISLEEVAARCDRWVQSDHEASRSLGILYPEVDWAKVMVRALPELAAWTDKEQADFVYAHIQLCHRVSLKPGAVLFLDACRDRGVRLALVSNAQAYTWRELDVALFGTGWTLASFEPDLNFWSFVAGFSKPDPEVFRGLAQRLAERGIKPGEALMIGDRFDNDIAPAREADFATWWLADDGDGDWFELGHPELWRI